MGVKFLSEEYFKEVETRLNAHDGFQNAAKGQAAKIQQVVTGAPAGEVHYWFQLEGGKAALGAGDIDGPEATVTQDFDTAVALSKGETTGQAAFMQGKLKVSGNLMKMMQLQGVLTVMPTALAGLAQETEY